jgi:hypothetical protein
MIAIAAIVRLSILAFVLMLATPSVRRGAVQVPWRGQGRGYTGVRL